MIEALRRNMMAQKVASYKVDWYPIIQGHITTKDMIAEYGDLFKTFDDAEDTYTFSIGTLQKLGAIAIDKSVTSITFGGNITKYVRIYEDGVFIRKLDHSGKMNVDFTSTESYKHIVFYHSNITGNHTFSWARWIILSKNYYRVDDHVGLKGSSIKYIHVENKEIPKNALLFSCSVNQKTISGYNGATMYIPDWYRGWITQMQFNQCTKIRLSKGVTGVGENNIYSWGTKAADNPNITDIYCHWGLGEVIQQTGNRYTAPWKLHIPDLGNEEDNAALVAEYRSKGWNYLSGGGIFNDVEETEPKEIIN